MSNWDVLNPHECFLNERLFLLWNVGNVIEILTTF